MMLTQSRAAYDLNLNYIKTATSHPSLAAHIKDMVSSLGNNALYRVDSMTKVSLEGLTNVV